MPMRRMRLVWRTARAAASPAIRQPPAAGIEKAQQNGNAAAAQNLRHAAVKLRGTVDGTHIAGPDHCRVMCADYAEAARVRNPGR